MFELANRQRRNRVCQPVPLDFELLEERCVPSAVKAFGHAVAPSFARGHVPPAVQAPLVPTADFGVAITNNVAIAAQGGDSVVFNVTVVNHGPNAATVNVQTSASGVKDLIWMAGSNGQDLGLGFGDVNYSVTLSAGQTAVFTLWGHVAIAQGIASESVTVSAVGASDPNLSNNSAASGIIVV